MKAAVIIAVSFGALVSTATATPIVSTFDAGSDGWSVQTRTSPTGSFGTVSNYSASFVASGGDPGGYISSLDPDGQWSFFRAPTGWVGDRESYYGRLLRCSTRTDTLTFPDGRLVVLIGNNGDVISHDAGQLVVNTWTRRAVPLTEGAWQTGANATGVDATEAQIRAVLADLEELLIGLEWGGDTAEELVDLDTVGFGICLADLTTQGAASGDPGFGQPDGLVTGSDINFYINTWLAQDGAVADLTTQGAAQGDPGFGAPDGQVTGADLNFYINLWLAGCP